MRGSIIALAACSGLTLAQNDTLQFFWPHAALYEDAAVSVKVVNPSTTVFHVACSTYTTSYRSASENCNWNQGMDYTIFNGSVYEATMTGKSHAMTRSCIDKSHEGVNCYAEGYDEIRSGPYIANEHWGGSTTDTATATITAGVEKLRPTYSETPSAAGSATAGSHATSLATASTPVIPSATGAADRPCIDRSTLLALFGAVAVVMRLW
jgi:hypothetical protein